MGIKSLASAVKAARDDFEQGTVLRCSIEPR